MFFKKITLLLLATCIFFAQAFPLIIESSSIAEVTKHVTDENTLVIFDIDNTILEAKDLHATDKWFSAMTAYAQSKGYDFNQAVEIVLPHYGKALEKTMVHPVETSVSDVIKDFQKKGNTVIALTSRSLPFVECTQTQLNSLKINLSQPPLGTKDITLSLRFPAKFINGILFCANNDKGEALQALLNELKIKTPSKIVYVDDKEKYLIAVKKFAESMKIPFVGIRYSYMDNEVKSFVLDEESKNLIPDLKTEQQEVKGSVQKTPEMVNHALTNAG